MVAGEDFAILHLRRIDLPKVQSLAPASAGPWHFEHLVEIAIEHFALPAHVDGVAAHEAVYRSGIKGVVQQRHVITEQVVVLQVGSETRDRQIRDGVELVEDDAEMVLELALIIGFELLLGAGKKRAVRIVNQMKREIRLNPVAS